MTKINFFFFPLQTHTYELSRRFSYDRLKDKIFLVLRFRFFTLDKNTEVRLGFRKTVKILPESLELLTIFDIEP